VLAVVVKVSMLNKKYTSIFKEVKRRLVDIMVRIGNIMGQMIIEYGRQNHASPSDKDIITKEYSKLK
jgi:hypothetical protein